MEVKDGLDKSISWNKTENNEGISWNEKENIKR